MKFDKKQYQKLKEIDKINLNSHSDFWKEYVHTIDLELSKNGFKNFGNKYSSNAGGFGDAPKITPRPFLRRIFKIPLIYRMLELFWVKALTKKTETSFFSYLESEKLTTINLLRHIANKVNEQTKELDIIRVINVDDKIIPHSYTKGAIHLHMIEKIISQNHLKISFNDIYNNNIIDIGGGIGNILHSYYEYNKINKFNPNSKFCILEQFPVSYMAKENISYMSGVNVKVYNNDNDEYGEINVIQNSSIANISKLNVSFYFNSSSFQEMNKNQIIEYIDFIKLNSSKNSYLGCFLYPSSKRSNSDRAVLSILNNHFKLLGWEHNYFDKHIGAITGIMYLYQVN